MHGMLFTNILRRTHWLTNYSLRNTAKNERGDICRSPPEGDEGNTDRLASIGAPISEENQVVMLLGSLPQSYLTLVTALEARADELLKTGSGSASPY